VIDKQKVCVVVPFYNEEQVIYNVIFNLISHNYKVLAVDDGSTDSSYEKIKDLDCTVIQHPQNFGQGAALQTGMTFAKLNPSLHFFVTFDSDGQHQVKNIEDVLNPVVNDEADIVFGTRFQDDLTRFTLIKKIILKLAVVYTKFSTGVALTDTHNGFRALNRTAIEKIELNFPGMTHASEFVGEAAENNLRIKEVPVHVLYTKHSKRKGQSLWNAVNILTDLFLR
jgi:glycosyltransferase involved in cell wall biosynthesis